jgi:hypothetical protein
LRDLVVTADVMNLALLYRNLPYHFRRLALPKEYWSRSSSGNRIDGIPVTLAQGIQTNVAALEAVARRSRTVASLR